MWDWSFAFSTLPRLFEGLVVTLQASLAGAIGAGILGLLWAVVIYLRIPILSRLTTFFVDFIRGTPLLVQLYFLFYVLPEFGLVASAFVTGAIGLSLYFGSYCAEVFRAGINNVPRGQWEVARALSLSPQDTWTLVVLPQALRAVIPPTGNYLLLMFKQSALLSTITVGELLHSARAIGSETYRYIEPLTMAGVIYMAISIPAAIALRSLERHFAKA